MIKSAFKDLFGNAGQARKCLPPFVLAKNRCDLCDGQTVRLWLTGANQKRSSSKSPVLLPFACAYKSSGVHAVLIL